MLTILANALTGKLATGLISIWLKDETLLSLGASVAYEALQKKTNSFLEQRKLKRLLEQIEDDIIEALSIFLESEFRTIKPGDKVLIVERAILLVSSKKFYDACFEEGFDHNKVITHFEAEIETVSKDLLIPHPHAIKAIHGFVFAKYLSIISELPTFSVDALKSILSDTDEILERISSIEIEIKSFEIREKQKIEDDEKQYRKMLARKLRKINIFGLDSRGLPKRYDLTIAYINLALSTETGLEARDQHEILRTAFSDGGRLITIKGEPGSGKTTLLSWLAMKCAEFSLPTGFGEIHDKLPIFIKVREYATRDLPRGKEILTEQFGVACDSFSETWLEDKIRKGNFLVFLDGFDEVVESRRKIVIDWSEQILTLYPNATVVISTRPYAGDELEEVLFEYCEDESQVFVEPMSPAQVNEFINSWYLSFSGEAESFEQKSRFEISRDRLLERLNHNSSLRSLIRNPLICSLICFVNADRDGFVPDHRGDLYRLATETLLDRRERERGILEPTDIVLTLPQKVKIMGHISEYFFKRRRTQLEKTDVVRSLEDYLPALALASEDSEKILNYLCQRSHVLRSPGPQEVDFSHKTFLEYFFAKRLAEQGMFEQVTDEFFLQEFREVVLFAFSVGPTPFVEDVLISVMQEIREMLDHGQDVSSHVLVLQTAIQQAAEVKANLREQAIDLLKKVLPPRNAEQAIELAGGGEVILEPLKEFSKEEYREYWRFVVLAALNTFSDDAVYALIPFAELGDSKIDQQLVDGRKYFENEDYRKIVISKCKTIRVYEVSDWSDLELLPSLPNLTRVVIKGYSDQWSDVQLTTLDKVKVLEISGADSITDLSILQFVPNLQELEIKDCRQLSDFSHISMCKQLRHLTIYSFDLTDLDMLRPLKRLQFLDVAESTDLYDVGGVREITTLKSIQLPYSHLYDKLPQKFEETNVELDFDFIQDAEIDIRHISVEED